VATSRWSATRVSALSSSTPSRSPCCVTRVNLGSSAHGDPVFVEGTLDGLAGLRFLRRNNPVGGLDQGDRGVDAGERLRELHADRSGSQDQQRRRRLGDPNRIAVCPVGAALVGEPVDRDLVVPVGGGLITYPVGDRAPIRAHIRTPGQPRKTQCLGQRITGADHHLGRDTGEIWALATDQAFFYTGDIQSGTCQALCHGLTADTHSEHDDTCVGWRHEQHTVHRAETVQ
jgi:hypothetical protein